ncbi:uncharacterized protein N7515_003193 [Penicillium bovifimosum]|uniref:RNase III domain-containing protein n=1 Tax=Penicillium bovifimosum TaxID=126998 RepID=A0A9W9L600_9EURO|nr:uncharacterized protein N7515_003193 [Penicillium bovifimosum]KAJ5138345.1 hypothetical protein N7515_003193 [Penicillium bovifimosum]
MYSMADQYSQPLSSVEQLKIFEKKINYNFNDPALIRKALHHPYNKQLRLVGAASMRLVLSADGFRKNESLKGIEAVLKERTGKGHLCIQGFNLGIDKFILLDGSHRGVVEESMMITTMQAIIGAVHVDSSTPIDSSARTMAALGLSWPE